MKGKKFWVVAVTCFLLTGISAFCAADDAEIKLNSNDGSTGFVIQNQSGAPVFKSGSDGSAVITGTAVVNGMLGIGTANPGFKLDVAGGARFWNSTGGRSGVQIGLSAGSGTAIEGIASNGTLTSPMWINYGSSGDVLLSYGGGNVGIGTASPGQKLSVAGTIESTSGIEGLEIYRDFVRRN